MFASVFTPVFPQMSMMTVDCQMKNVICHSCVCVRVCLFLGDRSVLWTEGGDLVSQKNRPWSSSLSLPSHCLAHKLMRDSWSYRQTTCTVVVKLSAPRDSCCFLHTLRNFSLTSNESIYASILNNKVKLISKCVFGLQIPVQLWTTVSSVSSSHLPKTLTAPLLTGGIIPAQSSAAPSGGNMSACNSSQNCNSSITTTSSPVNCTRWVSWLDPNSNCTC